MPSYPRKRGFTYIELIVVIVIIAVGLAVAIPYIQSARENARQRACINNMKALGLAMHSYHDLYKRFPGSADLIGSGSVKQAGGYSFLVRLLPFMGQDKLFKTLPSENIDDPLSSTDKNVIAARNTLISEFICPCNPNKYYENAGKKLNALTNYKGMGATSAESLLCCADPSAMPPYADSTFNPDGALFPGKGLSLVVIRDAASHTIMSVETIDDSTSVWIAGSDATLVGMPKVAMSLPIDRRYPWRPAGFNGKYYEDAAPEIQALRTYLAFDFSPGGKDAGTYPSSVGRTPKYGPSSGHPTTVNHLFGDGSVHSIRKDVDFAMYFLLLLEKIQIQRRISLIDIDLFPGSTCEHAAYHKI
jgi:prepilin-type N-terminal cleavage/methylation domain-containing protein